ncbi:MAG: hypothetical protein AAF206_18430 [Bacteroidota bacterium]
MRNLLVKSIGFCLLVLLIQIGVSTFLQESTSFDWGNPYLRSRVDHLTSHPNQYNLLAVGSSRIMCHVEPDILDAMLAEVAPIKSFNAGLPGVFAPQTYRALEGLLEMPEQHFEYVLLELAPPFRPSPDKMQDPEFTYSYTLDDYLFGVTTTMNQPGWKKQYQMMFSYGYTYGFVGKMLNIGMFRHYANSTLHKSNPEYLGLSGKGFVNLEDAVRFANDPGIRNGMASLREGFLQDTTVLNTMRTQAMNNYAGKGRFSGKRNPAHEDRLKRIMALCEQKGVELIFMIPPRESSPELIEWMKLLPEGKVIELSDPNRFPEYYVSRYSFDDMHLNTEGAMCMTEALGTELAKILRHTDDRNVSLRGK